MRPIGEERATPAGNGCQCICHSYPDHMRLQDALEALKWNQEHFAERERAAEAAMVEKAEEACEDILRSRDISDTRGIAAANLCAMNCAALMPAEGRSALAEHDAELLRKFVKENGIGIHMVCPEELAEALRKSKLEAAEFIISHAPGRLPQAVQDYIAALRSEASPSSPSGAETKGEKCS
jgi:hypothetical protein